MPTGQESVQADASTQLGSGDFDLIRTEGLAERRQLLGSVSRYDAAVLGAFALGARRNVTAAGVAGSRTLTLAGSGTGIPCAAVVSGNAATGTSRLLTWQTGDDGIDTVPFEDDTVNPYYVALRDGDRPTEVTVKLDGTRDYYRYQRSPGEVFLPNAFSEPLGAGNGLRVTIVDTLMPVWVAGATRPAVVWLDTPVSSSSSIAIHVGLVESDGANLYVDIPNYLGQTPGAHSVVPGDYNIHVPGLTISRAVDTTAQLDAAGAQIYHTLGIYDSAAGTFDATTQEIALGLKALSDLLINLFTISQVVVPGCYIGGMEVTRDWNAVANVVVNTGVDPVTLTFTDILAPGGRYFSTGRVSPAHTPVIVDTWESTQVASFPKANPDGDYWVIVEAVPAIGSDSYDARLSVVTDAVYTTNSTRVLGIFKFAWVAGGPTVTPYSQDTFYDLGRKRGFLNASALADDAESATGHAQFIRDIVGDYQNGLTVLLGDDAAAPNTVTNALRLFRTPGNALDTGRLEVKGLAGAMGADETIKFILGGAGDGALTVQNNSGSGDFAQFDFGGGLAWSYPITGGQSVDFAGVTRVEDLQIYGGNGKLIDVVDNVGSGYFEPFDLDRETESFPASGLAYPLGQLGDGWAFSKLKLGNKIRIRGTLDVLAQAGGNVTVEIQIAGVVVYSVATIPAAMGNIFEFDAEAVITTLGAATGLMNVMVRRTDVAGTGWVTPPGAAGVLGLYSAGNVAVNTEATSSTLLRVATGAGENVVLRSLSVETVRAHCGWEWSQTVRSWYCEGDPLGRELRIPLERMTDSKAAAPRETKLVEVYCDAGLNSPAVGDTMDIEVFKRALATGVETSLMAAPLTVTTAVAPRTLALAAEHVLNQTDEIVVKVSATNGADGTLPEFMIRSLRHQERIYELR